MSPSLPHFEHCRILHVDDNEDDSFLFQQALARLGCKGDYEWIDSGPAALSWLSGAARPNIIVADGYRAAGPELLQHMRDALGGDHVPIVVYSGDSDKHAMEDALHHGATGFILKRATFEDSVIAVGRILNLCKNGPG
ncbi:MAG TPA: response regulator [Methylomirabilota bacterium]|nr:response regulator [Methylomirabilota bacterium]